MTQPTPEELLGHHLKYEIDMLIGTLLAMGRSTDVVLENALKESFCIHARALLEFFSKSRGAKKYARAVYESFEKITDGEVADLLRLLNNQIAHLLDGRTADDSKKISDKERHRIINILKDEIALARIFKLRNSRDTSDSVRDGTCGADECDNRHNEWADRAVWSRPRRMMKDFAVAFCLLFDHRTPVPGADTLVLRDFSIRVKLCIDTLK